MAGLFKILSKTVATAGTAEQLVATETLCYKAVIQAERGNTGFIRIGASNAVEQTDDTTGLALQSPGANEPALLVWQTDNHSRLLDLSQIWLDASVNGEGVVVMYWL